MWCCSRSRSTVTLRAFECLDECVVFASPLYASYLRFTDAPDPHRDEVFKNFEPDYKKMIATLTGELPEGKSFSFQRHVVQHVLPEFGRDWLKCLNNFFLIRHPKEMISSYHTLQEKAGIKQELTLKDIGVEALYRVFQEVEAISGATPIVIESTDLAKNPSKTLKFICESFQVNFSPKMLSWNTGLKDSVLQNFDPSKSKEWLNAWCSTLMDSSGFLPYEENDVNLPDELIPLLEECLPFYEKLVQHRQDLTK